MLINITRQSIACFIASAFYAILGLLLLSGGNIISIAIAILLFAGAIGAYYQKLELLNLCLVIFIVASLVSLITISPLDPELHPEEIDEYMQDFSIRIMITASLYILSLIYFYCLNAIRKFPIKQIISTLIFFFLITTMIIYLRN